jgi:DDE domain
VGEEGVGEDDCGLSIAIASCAERSSGPTGQRTHTRRKDQASSIAVPQSRQQPHYPSEVIVLAVRWYLRFGLSYRDVEELLAERGVEVDHVTIYRWVLRFTPLLTDAARPCRHAVGDRWQVDETHVKAAGRWRYVYCAIDQFGQVIDVFISARRDATAAHQAGIRVDALKVRSRTAATERITESIQDPKRASLQRVAQKSVWAALAWSRWAGDATAVR